MKSNSKLVFGSLVHGLRVIWVNIRANIALTTQHNPLECVGSGRQLRLLLKHGLDRFSLGETTLESESFSGHVLTLIILSLHLKFVSLRKKLINDFVKLLEGHLTPLPLVTALTEIFPSCFLGP